MYSIIKTIVRRKGPNQPYQEEDISSVRLADAFTTYSEIYLILENDFQPGKELGLDLTGSMRNVLQTNLDTVGDWLVSNGNNALPTSTDIKELVETHVKYKDAFDVFSVTRTFEMLHPDNDYPLDDRRTLLLKSKVNEDEPYEDLIKHSLFTLNGVLHYSEPSPHGIAIRNAVDTLEHCNIDTIGYLSFDGVCNVEQMRITDDLISQDANENPLYKKIAFTFQDSIVDKTIMLSFMGKLFYLPRNLKVVNDHTVVFNLGIENMGTLWQKVMDRIPLDSLPINWPDGKPTYGVSVDKLQDPEVIKAMLKLPQSFIIVCDKPLLFDHSSVMATKFPGQYLSDIDINEPLKGNGGFLFDYKKRYDWGKWIIDVIPNYGELYNHDTVYEEGRSHYTGAARVHTGSIITAARRMFIKTLYT